MKTDPEMIYLIIPRAHEFMEILRFPATSYGRLALSDTCDALSNDNRPYYIADSVVDLVEPEPKKGKGKLLKRVMEEEQ